MNKHTHAMIKIWLKKFIAVSLYLLTHLLKFNLFSNTVLNDQQKANDNYCFDTGTLIQHIGISGFGK